jgi:autotransporter-associated beta strand protein
LQLGSGANVNVADGAAAVDLDVAATVSSGSINKIGTGTLRLTGDNGFSGGLTLAVGSVLFAHNNAAGTGTLTLAGASLAADGGARALANAVQFSADTVIGGTNDLFLNGPVTLAGGNRRLTIGGGITASLGGAIGEDSPIGRGLAKTGAGSLILSGAAANAFSGTFTVEEGTVLLDKTVPDGAVAGPLVIGSATPASVQLLRDNQIGSALVIVHPLGTLNLGSASESLGTLDIRRGTVTSGTGTFSVANIQMAGGTISSLGPLTLSGNVTATDSIAAAVIAGSLVLGGTSTFNIADSAGVTHDLDVSAAVSGAAGHIVKSGVGTLRLTGTNSFAGGLTVNAGSVAFGSNTAAGTGLLTLNDSSTIFADTAPRTLANSVSLSGSVTVTGQHALELSGPAGLNAPSSLNATGPASTVLSGAITGAHALNKTGAGVLVLGGSAPNLFAGPLQVFSGSVDLSKTAGTAAVSSALTIAAGAVVNVTNSEQIADNAAVSVDASGSLQLMSASNEAIGALNLYGGRAVTDAGTLTVLGGITAGAGAETSVIEGRLSLGNDIRIVTTADNAPAVDLDISAAISNGTLSKLGAGTLRFSGAAPNTYAGTTFVNEGVLLLAKSIGTDAIAGSLVVGDGTGIEVVRYIAPHQVAGNPDTFVAVRTLGLLDLDGHSDYICDLNLEGGSVTTGNGALGLTGTLTGVASSATATVSGNLLLNSQAKTFSIADGSAAVDVDISAVIADGAIVKQGAGALRFSGANVYAGGTTLSAGTLIVAGNAALGTGLLTGAGGTLQVEGSRSLANPVSLGTGLAFDVPEALTLGGTVTGSGLLTKNGAGVLTFAGPQTFAGGVTLNAGTLAAPGGISLDSPGTFIQNGGTFTGVLASEGTVTQHGGDFGGTLTNFGAFDYNGGLFSGVLENFGVANFNANFTAGSGLANFAAINVAATRTLTANGTGLVNFGTLTLNNGNLAGAGVTNDFGGLLSARGTITAPLTNNSLLDVTGLLTLTAAATNNGLITAAITENLRTNGAFTNSAIIELTGGTLSGAGAVTNATGATIRGHGTVAAALGTNAGLVHANSTSPLTLSNLTGNGASGELRIAGDATLNITGAFSSAGAITLQDINASLTGGALANTGTISGLGRVTNALTNNGAVEALGGTLTFSSAATNGAAGLMTTATGTRLVFTTGLSANSGVIELAGGTLNNNGAALDNSGLIGGDGTLRTGGLTNSGLVALTGDTSIFGDVNNTAGGRIVTTSEATSIFFANVVHNGVEIRTNAGSSTIFLGSVSGAGPFTGTGTVYFEGDLRPGNSPASVLYEGDVALGSGSSLVLEIGELLAGAQYDRVNVGGTFFADGTLEVALLDGFAPHFGDVFDLIDAGNFAGGFDAVALPQLGGDLAWDDSQLASNGTLRVVPEPGIGALLLSAALAVAASSRRIYERRLVAQRAATRCCASPASAESTPE